MSASLNTCSAPARAAGSAAASAPSFNDRIDALRTDPAAKSLCATFLARVRENHVPQPVFLRSANLAALLADTSIAMKYREKPAHLPHLDDTTWERFALSLGDCFIAWELTVRLPALAAAFRLTGSAEFLAPITRQLEEIARWSPFMRPGWSSGREPDGAWLGTGWMVRTVTDTLSLLPAAAVAPELRAALDERLRSEIAGVRDDWRHGRSWFIRDQAAHCNHWVLPNEALVRASLHLGLDRHRDDYEFGLANLIRSIEVQGAQGEYSEGMHYSGITCESVFSCARTAAEIGDDRLISHPYLRKFPAWYVHHQQPAGRVINAFDSEDTELDWEMVGKCVNDVADPGALWILHRAAADSLKKRPGLEEFVARASAIKPAPPSLFAHYPAAARVNWMDHWEEDGRLASGFWMRGGHPTDTHDHQDRGHVNFTVRGRPVLIEAGLYSYGAPNHPTHFKSVAGHNVLQVGPHAPEYFTAAALKSGVGQIFDRTHRTAPVTVHRLDTQGGDIEMDGSACYASTKQWTRRVRWDAEAVEIHDEVLLHQPDTILFRWHLGAPATARVDQTPDGSLRVGDILVSCESLARDGTATPITLAVEPMPDRTLQDDRVEHHATVVVRTAHPAPGLSLRTRVRLAS